jgi:hypothetical protein
MYVITFTPLLSYYPMECHSYSVVVLVVVMLVIVPLLNAVDTDNSFSVATHMVLNMAIRNSTDPSNYSVS